MGHLHKGNLGSFPFVPPSTLCAPQLQSTCHYIVNYYVKILHVRLGGANNMRPLSWGGTNGKDPEFVFPSYLHLFLLSILFRHLSSDDIKLKF